MPVITKVADAKSSTENDVYNNRSIQELEQRLEELVLEEPPCQTKVNVQSSVLPIKETAHDASVTYRGLAIILQFLDIRLCNKHDFYTKNSIFYNLTYIPKSKNY